MKLAPYNLPSLPGFKSAAFQRSTATWRARLLRRLPEKGVPTDKQPWGYPADLPLLSSLPSLWQPKVYVCVGPRGYWPALDRLTREFTGARAFWKFWAAESRYERPDKIVFYCGTPRQTRLLVRRLRTRLVRVGFHELRHAAPASALGLEAPGRGGIYVGCDPVFLRVSWRMYHTLCWAWAEKNAAYLEGRPGGRAGWLERMNLSVEHEGPATLAPDPRNVPFIRRWWRTIAG